LLSPQILNRLVLELDDHEGLTLSLLASSGLKKAWQQPVVFRPTEEDKMMLDWLAERMYLKPAQVLRQGLKRLYDTEKRHSKR